MIATDRAEIDGDLEPGRNAALRHPHFHARV
jgi:hypothetical protein